jgi:hypothetical protein
MEYWNDGMMGRRRRNSGIMEWWNDEKVEC